LEHRPFRFGLQAERLTDPAPWLARARHAEETGYSAFLVPDHLSRLATFPSLMAAAAATQHIKLASYVLNQDWRPPTILAQEAESVQLLTGGRLELGIGAGWAKHEYAQAGLQFDTASVRVERFEEYLRVVKGILNATEPFSFAGRWFKADGYASLRTGAPPPPILVGGGSPRILAIAGQLADIISVSTRATPDGYVDATNVKLEALERKIGWIRESAGERLSSIELNMTVREVSVTADRRAAARRILQEWRHPGGFTARADELTEDDVLTSPYVVLGSVDEIVQQLHEARDRWGFSYIEVSGRDFDTIAPVVERLAGQ
jgi:probable F420-dependent oxidoreductase